LHDVSSHSLIVFLTLPACSNDDDSQSPSSTGGVAGSSAGTGGAAGEPAACVDSSAHVEVTFDPLPTGSMLQWNATGAVVGRTETTFDLDTCSPAADCLPQIVTIKVEAPGLELPIPVDAYVQVHLETHDYAITRLRTSFSVRNLPEWDGSLNPVASHEDWYLLTNEQLLAHPEASFALTPLQLTCATGTGKTPKAYDVEISVANGGPSVVISQHESAQVAAGGQDWNIRLLRAFHWEGTEEIDPFSWWAVRKAD
jgi:hypothetical protein